MKNVLLIGLICLLLSCVTGNSIHKEIGYHIVRVPIVQQNDTIISNELRFYKIKSAHNSMQLMYDNHGDWDLTLAGRYQANVPQLVWKNIDLINNGKVYTVSASGTETIANFFTSFVILDENGEDVLAETNKTRQLIIDYFRSQMKQLGSSKNFLSVYLK